LSERSAHLVPGVGAPLPKLAKLVPDILTFVVGADASVNGYAHGAGSPGRDLTAFSSALSDVFGCSGNDPVRKVSARLHRQRLFPQSSSASRLTAGAAGFLVLIQSRVLTLAYPYSAILFSTFAAKICRK
jgi:hypothetical protein